MDTTGSLDLTAAGGAGGAGHGGTQLWKTHDALANKTGAHHTVYWVKDNAAYKKAVKLGIDAGAEGKYLTGSQYQGDWDRNRKHGFGTLTKPNGERYEGEWVANKRQGKGTLLVRISGKYRKKYTGDWFENRRHGLGVYFYDSGAKFEGEWYMGKRHGRGKMVYDNGDVYEGDWVDDKRAGLGVLTLASGDHYEGHWHNDKKEGPGRYFYLGTRKMYEGEWADDVAKCGVFSDIPFEIEEDVHGDGGTREDAFALPPCTLAEADAVVVEAVDAVRAWRLDQLRAEGVVTDADAPALTADDLTDEEFAQLQDAFGSADYDGTGMILGRDLAAVLASLGIEPSEEDLGALLEELGASAESPIAFQDFADCMARLRE